MMKNASVINNILTVLFIVMAVTGILSHPFSDIMWFKILHASSGILFIIGTVIHILQHRKAKKG